MPLTPGTRLGSYEIRGALGAGGMGEVYHAEDTKLGRTVAIKTLGEAFAADPERVSRLRREARALATLNHPNIGAIYDLEEIEGHPYLVLEYVEGDELAERLERGPIPLDEALAIAGEIASALTAAHDRGLVHRDLKPANVKLTPDGDVKVLDFGLAKAREENDLGAASDLTSSPTAALSQTGVGTILGTARYMSPEQARGRAVDARADIWAWGVVLFEMLAGEAPFEGDTLSDVLAAILRDEPRWDALPADTPPRVRELLELCLKRKARERLRDLGDARLWLQGRGALEEKHSPPVGRRAGWWPLAAGAALAVAAVGWALWTRPGPAEPPPVQRYRLAGPELGQDVIVANPAVSPDGRRLLFVGFSPASEEIGLFQRTFDALSASVVEGTRHAGWATYSPDGSRIAFYDVRERDVKRISIHGGQPTTLVDPGYIPMDWAEDGFLYFTMRGGGEAAPGIWRVSAEGGEPEELTRGGREESGRFVRHAGPRLLPGGRAVVFAIGNGYANSGWDLAVLDLESRQWHRIVEHGVQPLYLAPGYLLFTRDERVWGVPFDASTLQVRGEPRPVIEDVQIHQTAPLQVAQLGVSEDGTLVYVRGESTGERHGRLSFVGGGREPEMLIEDTEAFLLQPALSPDGRRVALQRYSGRLNVQVWVLEKDGDSWVRAAVEDGWGPVWTPDGTALVYGAMRDGQPVIARKNLAGGAEEILHADTARVEPVAFLPDGRSLLFWRGTGRGDILLLGSDGHVEDVVVSEKAEEIAALSPDGRWLAYESDVTGQPEVYLVPFPPGGYSPRLVSADGGRAPRWAPQGLRLFYREGYPDAGRIVAVEVRETPGLSLSAPVTVAETPPIGSGGQVSYSFFDVARDGRVLLPERLTQMEPSELVVVRNWPRELSELFSDSARSR